MPDSCAVSGSIRDIGFQPEEGAIVRFTLSGATAIRQSNSLVVPDFVEATTDANGDFTESLIPNRYTVEIITPSGGYSAPLRITVPDAATAVLAQIINLPPPPQMNAAEQAVLDAQAARDAANAAASSTAADRVQTGLDRAATAADRVATGDDRTAAAQSAGAALTHALAAQDAQAAAEDAAAVFDGSVAQVGPGFKLVGQEIRYDFTSLSGA